MKGASGTVRSSELGSVAEPIAHAAHAGQTDKAGEPYTGHLSRVAARLETEGPEAVAAGWLHDAIEDTSTTRADLLNAGIPERVVRVVELLTRTGKPDDEYYAAIKNDQSALAVKLADLADNTDPQRLAALPAERQAKLRTKYAKAYRALGRDDFAVALEASAQSEEG
ncbi:HD domain-containing protein [Segniliparus rugosus]|uniref:HD domain-containing protein n=1 Tax=Segniliparus rugosus (strain ATCC BAA-974 / DSM 45345 / CCUG 50838 / CIP 108380 / JCM 13579 / CDC 945) TaxID=679197 RepID=E5XMT3_SEGRC|nr:HD domain-containing protein [Segniliparus rugosus]EFV14353.1 hypothetical protein HMPREF9336_00803 [Segniliparus rugosus ATCC BAA-974]